jgi:hypothetical protein
MNPYKEIHVSDLLGSDKHLYQDISFGNRYEILALLEA